MRIELPFPPSVNTYWRKSQYGMYISKKGMDFRTQAVWEIKKQNIKPFGDKKLAMIVELFPPDKRKRDIDNFNKGLLDALAHAGVYDDDEQIDCLIIFKHKKKKGGQSVVTIYDKQESQRFAESVYWKIINSDVEVEVERSNK